MNIFFEYYTKFKLWYVLNMLKNITLIPFCIIKFSINETCLFVQILHHISSTKWNTLYTISFNFTYNASERSVKLTPRWPGRKLSLQLKRAAKCSWLHCAGYWKKNVARVNVAATWQGDRNNFYSQAQLNFNINK